MDVDYQSLFRSLPGLFVVVRPQENFTVVDASDAYLAVTFGRRDEWIGRCLFDVFELFPNEERPTATERNLRASFARVIATRVADAMPLQRYDMPAQAGAAFQERYWSPVNSPILGPDGEVALIVHRVEDATALVHAQRREDKAREVRAAAESARQQRIYETALSNTPDLVYIFDLEKRFVYANEALLAMWGKTREASIGKGLLELGYEPWHAQMHEREIDQVVATRKAIRGEVPFTGTAGKRVYDYIFVPVLGPEGDVVAIAGTTRDVTDRQRAEQESREHARRLGEADRAKDEFLATLSHELRNPLAPLRNGLTLLRKVGKAGVDTSRTQEMMERQVNHLVRLVDDLLEVSRLSRGEFALRKERVDLVEVVRHAVETAEPTVRASRHELDVSLPPGPVWLQGDPVRLAQVIANLIDNAAKYTEEGGRISVTADAADDEVRVSVKDNGLGIESEALPRMFEMFNRGERATLRRQGGLGIGLALSRKLTQMHGGRLEGRSEGPGKGSEFTVHLPAG